MQAHALEGGFTDAPIDAARAFRGLMTAMARPGTICDVSGATPPAPLGSSELPGYSQAVLGTRRRLRASS